MRPRRTLSAELRGRFEAASHHMLERKQSSALARSVDKAQETMVLCRKFRSEDRKPALCTKTLAEELFCQTTFTLLGPIASLWVVPICGVNGARITGFWPGAIPVPHEDKEVAESSSAKEEEETAGKKPGSGTTMFIFQLFWFFAFTLPMNLWIVLYATGHLVLLDDWSDTAEVQNNITNTEDGETFWTEKQPTEILPVAEVFLPLAILILRQIVISIKYAYRPRRQMRFERTEGRDMESWNDDMLGTYVLGFPRIEAVVREAERAAWRSGVPLDMINLQFDGEISDETYNRIDIRETTPKKDEMKEAKRRRKQTDATDRCENESAPAIIRPEQRNVLPARAAVKYTAFLASKIKVPFYVNPLSLVPIIIPFAFRLFHGRPAFGDSHFDKFVAATALFRNLDSSNTMLSFASAAGVLFDRQRLALDRWFSMLVPHTVCDAREVYHAIPSPSGEKTKSTFDELPDLSLTPRNIFAWDMGRKALRKIGLVYSLRLEKFLAVYLFVLSITVVWMVVDVLIKAATGQIIVLTAGLLMIAYFCFSLIVVFFGIVFSGMYTNRQQKLHGSAVAALRLRVETVAQCEIDRLRAQMEKIKRKMDDDFEAKGDQSAQIMQLKSLAEQLKSAATRSKEVQRALKLVGNGIESESETQKIRILGMAVDTRMLEALMGLLSALGVTLWQVVST